MWGMNPEQQAWWQHFLQTQASYHQAMAQQQMALSPWNQPGYSRFQNPLLNRVNVPVLAEGDPGAGMAPYFMNQFQGGMGGSDQPGGGVNPMLFNLMMGGGG